MRSTLLTTLLAALALVAASSARAAEPRVTVLSDSILTSVLWYPDNRAILGQGLDLDMEVAVCRRLAGTSCTFEGAAPPTLFDLLPTLSNLGQTVVVEMGYNDDPSSFGANVEETIAKLTARGVTRIIWPTLHVSRSEFAAMNEVLVKAMIAHPQLALVDWDGYSQGHGDWFQTDNLHLTAAGGTGIATLLHRALAEPLALAPRATLPEAKRGQSYRARLGDAGSDAGWQIVSGSLPRGLLLEPGGIISGRPLQAGSTSAGLLLRSAGSQLAYQQVDIVVGVPAPQTATGVKQPAARKPAASKAAVKKPAARARAGTKLAVASARVTHRPVHR
jgi:hypothetical protein